MGEKRENFFAINKKSVSSTLKVIKRSFIILLNTRYTLSKPFNQSTRQKKSLINVYMVWYALAIFLYFSPTGTLSPSHSLTFSPFFLTKILYFSEKEKRQLEIFILHLRNKTTKINHFDEKTLSGQRRDGEEIREKKKMARKKLTTRYHRTKLSN